MKPTLGVLITYYNEKELLTECLNSLTQQPNPPDEILIYDDASSFPAADYIPSTTRATVVRGENNRGPSYGRNHLLQISQSEFIHFHDADDLFRADWCVKVRQALEDNQTDAVITEINSYTQGKLTGEKILRLHALIKGGDLVRFSIEGAILPSAFTCRRSLVVEVGGYPEQLWQSEDFYFHTRLALKGVRYRVIEEPLVDKRLLPTNRSLDQVEVWTCVLKAIRLLSREAPEKYKSDLAEAAARAGSVLFRMGAKAQARDAFDLGMDLGPPPFSYRNPLFRFLARALGQESAEIVGSFYGKKIPAPLRKLLVRR